MSVKSSLTDVLTHNSIVLKIKIESNFFSDTADNCVIG